MTANFLPGIAGAILGRPRNNLPEAQPSGPDAQSVVVRLPHGQRTRVTFVRMKHKRGRSTRWFWTPDHAEIVSD